MCHANEAYAQENKMEKSWEPNTYKMVVFPWLEMAKKVVVAT
jgi:hypothetical protein